MLTEACLPRALTTSEIHVDESVGPPSSNDADQGGQKYPRKFEDVLT